MKNIIIGTAGHIDHGKTTLIKALTGHETDRLNEEKKRGISIELGFTYFDLPSGKRAGIIDVPGHERFIRNMLTGVSGMDIVMLVIAADEGIMQQTKEHLDILSLLKIKKGIIVITKTSLVDEEWLELIKEDIKERVKGIFLEDAEIIEVDSLKGIGINELINKIDILTEETESRDINAPTRMPIDRIFTITGFGTVVTGTLMEGKITVEDTLEILPDKVNVRIRNIQVHGESVKEAYAGQRVAINLANTKKEDIERGQILAQIDSMEPTMILDIKLNILKDFGKTIKNRERVRIYHGSTEILARIILLDREEAGPADNIYVQLRLEEFTTVKKDDHLIIRLYSPMETIGRGVVIDTNPKKHKRFNEDVLKDLAIREKGSPEEILEKQIQIHSNEFPDIQLLSKLSTQQIEDVKKALVLLVDNNKVVMLGNNNVIHIDYYEEIKKRTIVLLENYHKNNPLKKGMLKEEVRSRLFPKNKSRAVDIVVEILAENKAIKIQDEFVSLYEFEVIFSQKHIEIKNKLEKIYLDEPYVTEKIEDIIENLGFNKPDIQQVFNAILGDILIRLNQDIIVHTKTLDNAKNKVINYIKDNESITLAQCRDVLNTSRKYAVVLLEYFDNIKITKRVGEKRILV